jgi:hypothetical protein
MGNENCCINFAGDKAGRPRDKTGGQNETPAGSRTGNPLVNDPDHWRPVLFLASALARLAAWETNVTSAKILWCRG